VGEVLGGWRRQLAPAWRPAPLAMGSAAAALLLVGVAFTQPAVQAVAQGVLQSFRVQRVQPVRIDAAVLAALPVGNIESLFRTGTYTGPKEPKVRVSTVRDAAAATGLTLRAPARLPAGVNGQPTVYASEAIEFAFTYDGQKLAEVAGEMGVRDAAVQAQLRALNGVTVKGHIPPAAALFYGDVPAGDGSAAARQRAAGASTRAPGQGAASAPSLPSFLALIQLKAPSVDVPASVNVDQLREQLLRSGALPPALAAELLAIRDWKTALPFPVTRGTARDVAVDGTTATLITGEAPVPLLIWQKDGVLYVMGGPASEQALLDSARSLAPAR
jgi:hypothetical protein